MQLHVSHISYSYPLSLTPILSDVSCTLSDGWWGVIGPNGSGKSTFGQLIYGGLTPDAGSIIPQMFGAYCPQPSTVVPANLWDFGADYSKEAIKIRASLGIEDEWLYRYDSLSCGEQKRVQVACAWSLCPDVLILDEPSNHLDEASKDILTAALKAFTGIGILISHDRDLLDALCCGILEVRGGSVTQYRGNYSDYEEQSALARATQVQQRKKAKDNLARVTGEMERRKHEAARADARRSARHLAKHDSDARAKIGLAIYSGKDGQAGRLKRQMEHKVAQANEAVKDAFVEKCYDARMVWEAKPLKRNSIARVCGENIQNSAHEIVVSPTDHIGIRGVSGAGKTTWLRELIRGIDEDVQVLLIAQELTEADEAAVERQLEAFSAEEKGRVGTIIALLGSDVERVLNSGKGRGGDDEGRSAAGGTNNYGMFGAEGQSRSGATYRRSPGELRKLMLACGIVTGAQLIVMDEPTNHLDLPSIQALEEMLSDCPCALVCISHDRRFLERVSTRMLEVRAGEVFETQVG